MTTLDSAKISYLLCTCDKFSKKFFTKLFRKFEKEKIMCSKHYFNIWLVLLKPKNGGSSFILKNSYTNFLSKGEYLSDYDYNTLEQMNNLSDDAKKNIDEQCEKLFQSYTKNKKNHPYTIINLINKYHHSGRKYLSIPITLDYSQDIGFVHQSVILIDLIEGLFIFYEPYGKYVSQNYDYSNTVQQFFNIYKNVLPEHFIKDGETARSVKYVTYHEYFGLNRGIQNILLEKNNSKEDEFNEKYHALLSLIKRDFINLHEVIIKNYNSQNFINMTDKTVKVLDALDYVNDYEVYWKDDPTYQEYWKQMLELYALYNSKTCVSITLIEMNKLFTFCNDYKNDLNKSSENAMQIKEFLSQKIKEYYDTFSSEIPNTIIINDMYSLYEELFNDDPLLLKDNKKIVNFKHLC
jgi:hypothetical protein